MNYYLICLNDSGGFDSTQIHNIITKMPIVSDWWHYLPSVYIIQTTSILNTAKKMTDYISQNFKGLSFLVIKVDIRNYNGVLNKDAWEWFRKKNNQVLKFKAIPRPLDTSRDLLGQLLPNISQTRTTLGSITDALETLRFPKKKF